MHAGQGRQLVRHEEIQWGWDIPDQDFHLLPSFNGVCFIPCIVHFNKSSLQMDKGIPVEIEWLPLTQVYSVSHLSWWNVLLQIPVDNAFPRCDGSWCSQWHSTLFHGESQGNGCLLQLPYLYIPSWCWVSPQGSLFWYMEQQGLLVDYSNVLKPGMALLSTWSRCFYLLVI